MVTRRQIVQGALTILGSMIVPSPSWADPKFHVKKIPSSAEKLPAIGMGTWITFDVDPDSNNLTKYTLILDKFFQMGGTMIDSSPMYGYAQKLLGNTIPQSQLHDRLFSATKVWTMGKDQGISQMKQSKDLWNVNSIDLMYVHNMLDWETHLQTLNQWKKEGLIKYTGITTSHGRRHEDLIAMLKKNPVDFVQFTYNILNRKAEKYLLPLAQDLGVAVVINRPFQTGGLFNRVRNRSLPEWANQIGCDTWSQFFLKFIISHPAVTCAIPATSQLAHMTENMHALRGDLPDENMRKEMIRFFELTR